MYPSALVRIILVTPVIKARICNICDRLWENRPLRALLQNQVIGIQG